MSVALLSGNKAVEICDEIEAFFYVLLYYAARYLQSNLDGVTLANYLDEFFDQYMRLGDGWSCGNVKRTTIESGRLRVHGKVELQFGGPMDHTIAILLSWFHSHHVVSTYEEKRQEAKALKTSPVSDAVKEAGKSHRALKLPDRLVVQVTPAMLGPTTWGLPSSKDQLVWENVKKHAFVIKPERIFRIEISNLIITSYNRNTMLRIRAKVIAKKLIILIQLVFPMFIHQDHGA